jgi:type IV secretory pathway TrbF-like protein
MSERGNGGLSTAELERLEAAYRVLAARDGTAERKLHAWQVACVVLVLALIGLGVWDHLDRRVDAQAFVQVVQVNEDGRVIHLGVPQDLLAYTPQDAQWLDMVSEWVRRVRWRGSDQTTAELDWTWARAHLCGTPARTLLREMEQREKPFTNLGKTLRAVEIKAATATPAPSTYHVFWEEITTEATQQRVQRWAGTFTVSRFRPSSQAVLMHNRLGLCITAMDLSPQS